MSKIWTVIKREYLQIVKTKGFIISTVLGPVLMASFIVIPIVLSLATGAEKKHYAIIDAAGGMFIDLDAKLADYTMGDKSRRYTLEAVPAMVERSSVIASAQRARGLDTEGSLRARLRGILPLVGPVILSSLTEVEERSLALEVRAFGRPGRRQLLWRLPDSGLQLLARGLMLGALLAAIVLRLAGTFPRLP